MEVQNQDKLLKMKFTRGKLELQLKQSEPQIYVQKIIQLFEVMIT